MKKKSTKKKRKKPVWTKPMREAARLRGKNAWARKKRKKEYANPWDATGETELEYYRRVVPLAIKGQKIERVSQEFRLHIRDKKTGKMLSNDTWNWRMMSGVAVNINTKRYRVLCIRPHEVLSDVSVVWVKRETS